MKLILSILIATTGLCASERNREFETGRDYYMAAEFRKAVASFRPLCDRRNDADACYWTGLSYERLADAGIPFGCRTDAKAHVYLVKAARLAPARLEYRDALFEFLLSTADCSRTALREASAMLSDMSESDPAYRRMRSRLNDERHRNGSPNELLGRLLLAVPRATERVASLPAAALTERGAAGAPSSELVSCRF